MTSGEVTIRDNISIDMSDTTRSLFQMMSCMVNPDATSDVMMAVEFNFTDTNKLLRLDMRKGVCQVFE